MNFFNPYMQIGNFFLGTYVGTYLRLLSAASVDDTTKFARVDDKRPNLRGRPPKHYHPLLQKEKDLNSILHRILPQDIATSLSPESSRLAHLYGLPS